MRLMHNIASLNIYQAQRKISENQSTALGRISSGYKIISSKDSPNGLAQSERLRMQIRGLQMAGKNVQDGVSMLQSAEGGLDNITSMLQRVRELVVQSGSGANSPDDLNKIQEEITQMMKGAADTAKNTEFNGVKLLNDTSVTDNSKPGSISMPVGANVNEKVNIPTFNVSFFDSNAKFSDGSANNISSIDVTSSTGTTNALDMIDKAISTTIDVRDQYGALENRFDSTYSSISEIGDKIQGAESVIRDADVAEEMMNLAKDNVLIEAGNAMMVQTNKFPQDILRILEGVRR